MRVVVYDALGDEIDLSPLIESHGQPERRFAVTRTPDSGFALTVHPWGGPLELHKYGYRQPSHDAPVIEDRQIGAVLVPAMAFDVAGNRLGRGKGYYDRLLARLATSPSQRPTSVMFIGMAGGVLADDLPHDDHDVAMTHLALTTGVYPAPVRSPMTDGVEMLSFA